MRCCPQPPKVFLIANLIGESGEAAKQPLPDFSALTPTNEYYISFGYPGSAPFVWALTWVHWICTL